jgi:hypothetical protein
MIYVTSLLQVPLLSMEGTACWPDLTLDKVCALYFTIIVRFLNSAHLSFH